MVQKKSPRHDWREARRKRTLELEKEGWRPREIAEALGVSEAAVSRWRTRLRTEGAQAWRARPHAGRPPKLAPWQRRLIPDLLSHGAEAHGFRGDVWTCVRIARVLQREFGVVYHRSQVSRLLRELGWTPHQPVLRAAQRDEDEIERWRTHVWPDIKKSGKRAANDRLHR